VLLDEPTSMLDPTSAAVVRAAIISAVRDSGATLVMVEHQLSHWVDQVDRLVVLDPCGRVSVDGPVAETLATSAHSLAAQGVWVPDVAFPRPLHVPLALCAPTLKVGSVGSGAASGQLLVSAESVTVIRQARRSVMSENRPSTVTQALLDVCAEVSAGECVAVIGPSGAGKSTLTALLAGIDRPTRGRVRAGDPLLAGVGPIPPEDVHRWASRSLAARFGWVPQQAEQAVVARTVRGDVLSTSRRLGLNEDAAQARADELLAVLGLSALAGADPHYLSGGEQRRLALAGAIAHGPSVLVLDEPSVGQDRVTWSAVAGVVVAARDAGVGVVVATHDPLLIALADRRITLRDGQIVNDSFDSATVLSPVARPKTSPPAGRRWTGLASRSGPLSLLLASIVLVLGAPFITDLRTALIAVGAQIVLAPMVLGVGRPPWRRLLPGLFAVASVSFSNWLLSPGREVSTGALAGLRVVFFVVPSVLLVSRIEPSALGDHLAQRLRLPARPVVAAVAALHRFEGLGESWDQLARIRRVRGLQAGRSLPGRWRSVAALTFGLLVETLRQAGRMAVAMEARGFSATVPCSDAAPGPSSATSTAGLPASRRTWAEPAPWLLSDSLMLALGLLVAVIPLFVSRL